MSVQISVAITYDPVKRVATPRDRGLDLAGAEAVFAGPTFSLEDDRFVYGETRIVTIGFRQGRMVLIVWTPRGEDRHIISMRKCNDREIKRYTPLL